MKLADFGVSGWLMEKGDRRRSAEVCVRWALRWAWGWATPPLSLLIAFHKPFKEDWRGAFRIKFRGK